jgi:hypothetical protein
MTLDSEFILIALVFCVPWVNLLVATISIVAENLILLIQLLLLHHTNHMPHTMDPLNWFNQLKLLFNLLKVLIMMMDWYFTNAADLQLLNCPFVIIVKWWIKSRIRADFNSMSFRVKWQLPSFPAYLYAGQDDKFVRKQSWQDHLFPARKFEQ